MKKIFVILISLFCGISSILAKDVLVVTYERTESNYLVPDSINVTSSNKQAILKTPAVLASEKVYDFANLLTENEEEQLYNQVITYIENTNYDLALVTINENNKYSAMKYADDFFDYNDFGINSSRDGSLILIDMDTREIWVSTSGQAIKMYSDSRIDNIIDAGFFDLKNAQYYDCLSKMIDKMDYYFDLGVPSSNRDMEIDEDGNPYYVKSIPYVMIFIISGVICTIVSLILYFKTSSKIKKQNTVTYINPNLSNLIKNDQFLTTYTSRIRIESSSSSGGGGSSHHSSSSGRSHGGGGRHF